jgi:hypothetical protein
MFLLVHTTALRMSSVLATISARPILIFVGKPEKMAFFCGHLSAVGTAKNTLNGGPKFASERWCLSSQSKRLSGVSSAELTDR